MQQISIDGERFFADLIGTLADGRIACLGFTGRRSGIRRAKVNLYSGKPVGIDGALIPTLGEKAYRAYTENLDLPQMAYICVIPNAALTRVQKQEVSVQAVEGDADDGDHATDGRKTSGKDSSEKSVPPILVWRESAGINFRQRVWDHIYETTPIPLVDEWRDPILDRLLQLNVEQPQGAGESAYEPQKAIAPVEFNPNQKTQWCGVSIELTENQVGEAVQQALRCGEIHPPKELINA